MSHLQPDEALYSLLCKYLLNEAEAPERAWVDAWRKEGPANEAALAAIRRLMEAPAPATPNFGISTDSSWERLRATVTARPAAAAPEAEIVPLRRRNTWWMAAAAVAVLLMAGFWGLKRLGSGEQSFSGGQTAALHDGSRIQLAGNGTLTVDEDFGEEERRVRVSGKADFDIAPAAGKPFIVEAGGTEIKVLGTRFTVSFDTTLFIQVESGKIQVTDPSLGEPVVMTEGMSLRRNGANGGFEVSGQPERPMVFRDVPFGLVVETVEKRYKVNITVADPAMLEKRITVHFSGESVEEVIDALAYMVSASVESPSPGSYKLQPL
ncbi:FecR family protein [Chitinophaga sp.]|uniref:FecR family protein n=1 Tax=Chitinophaga sp. TaxID=1869181 RepID=UPI0026031268|nr:FecR domain-containing protein [uncultured Chitinophaga sp.]